MDGPLRIDSDESVESLVRGFEECTIPRGAWTHEAHLAMAAWYLRRHPRDEATQKIRQGIQRFNSIVGDGTGYHETLTLAWTATIARFLALHDRGQPISSLVCELLALCGDRRFLQRYYRTETLMSGAARQSWVPPDLVESIDEAAFPEPGYAEPAEYSTSESQSGAE